MLAEARPSSTIKFEDATAASGIQFTHSFGSQKLGSLLEGTGGGCVWFDYNNDGMPDLYVTSGRPLEDGIHPYPLKQKPEVLPHNHLFRNDGNGKFTDVTDQAGVAANIYGMAVPSRAAGSTDKGLGLAIGIVVPRWAKRYLGSNFTSPQSLSFQRCSSSQPSDAACR
jgi:hypothetical protein